MRLTATLPAYKQVDIDIDPKKSVKELKIAICNKLGIEPELTKLLVQGKVVSEKQKASNLKETSAPIVVDYLWARHLILWGLEGQKRIREATVLLGGAGAIGNEVAKNLALLGIGRLIVVDRDNVELSNVSRMIFFRPEDLGANKAEVLAKTISSRYPFVETLAFRGELERLPLKFYLDSDVVVCGLDNVVSRIYLAEVCRRYSIPMADGGITGLSCRVHVYIPPDDACPICMFPPIQYSRIAGLRNPCDAPVEQETVPSLATSISLVSSVLAQETIKVILGFKDYKQKAQWPSASGQPLKSVLFVDLKNNRFTPLDLKRNEKCFVCGKEGTARDIARKTTLSVSQIQDEAKGYKLEKPIRKALNLKKETLRVMAETNRGTTQMDGTNKEIPRLRYGDYLRVFAEKGNGELHESILKLT